MKNTAKLLSIVVLASLPVTSHAGAYGASAVKDAAVANSGASGGTVWCDRIEADVPERLAADMNCGGAAARPRGLRGFFASLGGSKAGPDRNNDNDDVVRRPLPPTTTVSTDPDPTPPSAFTSKADRLADFNTSFDRLGEMSDQFQAEARDYREQHGGRGDWSDFNPSVSQ